MNGRIREYCVLKYNNYHAIRNISAPTVISKSRTSTKMTTQSGTRTLLWKQKNTHKKSPKVPIINKINNFYTNRPFQKNPHPMKSERKYTQNILFIESTRCKITRGNPRVKGPRTQTTQRNYGIHATRSLCNAAAFQHRFHGHAGGMWRKTKWETGRNGGTKKRK